MKKYLNKRLMGVLLCIVMCFSLLVGCGGNANEGNNTSSTKDIVAVLDGKEISRETVGDNLLLAEQEVIAEYIKADLQDKLFKDVEVTEEEVTLQLELMKAQVGEESWPMYLVYYGGGDEETFKETLKKSMKQEKFIAKKAETIEITEEEILERYNTNPDSFNIAVLDTIFFSDVETLEQGITLMNEGKTLEEISEELGIEIYQDEHTYYNSDNLNWSKSLSESKVGDMITTDFESGSLVIGRVKTLNAGLENSVVKDDIVKNLKYEKAYADTEHEFIHLMIDAEVEIMGQPYTLYDEEHTH